MLVFFSSQIPIESTTLDAKYSPFKSFVIETSKSIQTHKFLNKSTRNPKSAIIPSCAICNMHFTSFSIKKMVDNLWICSFCEKENKINSNTLKRLDALGKYYIKEPNDLSYISTTDLYKPQNLVILILDFSILMSLFSAKVNKKHLNYTDFIAFLLKRDLMKYTEKSRFCLMVCSTEVLIMGNSDENYREILPFTKIENMKFCFEFGRSLCKNFFSSLDNSYRKLLKKLEKIEPRGLSSIGSGLAVSFGILSEMKPINHKIIVIGEGTIGVGVCRNYELGEFRDCSEEIDDLRGLVKNSQDLNLYLYNISGEDIKENFLYSLKKKMKIVKYVKIDENDEDFMINLSPETNGKNEYMIKIAASSNITLIPNENLQKNLYNFEEKRRTWVMNNVYPDKNLYPFSFEFSTIGGNSETILIQMEYIIKKEEETDIFITTKQLKIVKFRQIEFPFLNFTVANYCYFMNDFMENKEKMKSYLELINIYFTKSLSQVEVLRFLKNYIENKYKYKFEIKLPFELKEDSLLKFVQKRNEKTKIEKNDFKIYGKIDQYDDFEKLMRVSKKKMLQRK